MNDVAPTRDPGRVVIVGGGLAGYSAAESLRAFGHRGPVTIIDAQPALYDRPPLSKELFTTDLTVERLAFAPPQKLATLGVEAITKRVVTAIDPDEASVALDDGRVLPADTILLAPGGRARRLRIPGGGLTGVRVLRDLADAKQLRSAVHPGVRVVVVGAGLIGAELASALIDAGADVVALDPAPLPLVAAVGEVMAEYLHHLHAARGVRVATGIAERIDETENGLAVAVAGSDERIPADLVVVGVGIDPNTELAEAAGIEVDGGILVNAQLRTSAPRVFAAGDACRRRGENGALERREEHWEAAQLSGREAAAGMLGLPIPPRGAPWFWSDRHGVHLEAVGRMSGAGEIVVRRGDEQLAVFLVANGELVGAASVNDPNTVRAARRLIDQHIPVSATDLADPAVSLRTLLKAAR